MYERKGQAKEPSARTETGEETAENTVRRRLCKQRRKTEQKTITNMQQEEKTHVMAYYTHTRERNKENGRQSRKEQQTPTNKKTREDYQQQKRQSNGGLRHSYRHKQQTRATEDTQEKTITDAHTERRDGQEATITAAVYRHN